MLVYADLWLSIACVVVPVKILTPATRPSRGRGNQRSPEHFRPHFGGVVPARGANYDGPEGLKHIEANCEALLDAITHQFWYWKDVFASLQCLGQGCLSNLFHYG